MKEKKRKKVPLWVEVVCILLIGVIASVSIVLFANIANAEKFLVTFAYQDGTIIETKEVEKGKGVFPPNIPTEGVFRGWSGAFNNVSEDIEVHPNIYTIVEENLFYHNAVYVKEGKKFSLDILVGGKINVCSGEILIEYDTNAITFKRAKNLIGVNVSEDELGKIKISFDMNTDLTETTVLTTLDFKSKKVDAYSTELLLSAENVNTLTGDVEKKANFATINNKIYFLQEVSK